MMATAFHLGQRLAQSKYNLVVNLGVCGSFRNELKPGSVVHVTQETIADLGAGDEHAFRSVFDLGLADLNAFPFERGTLRHTFDLDAVNRLPQVKGISVNTVSSSPRTIERLQQLYDPDVESMEGAAVFYACMVADVPFIEVRAISNYVGETDRTKWKLDEAIAAVNKWVINLGADVLNQW